MKAETILSLAEGIDQDRILAAVKESNGTSNMAAELEPAD